MSIFSDRIVPASSVYRDGRAGVKPDVIILHHSATTNYGVVKGMMSTGSRKVSSNVVIENDGDIHPCVWESDTPFTNAHLGWNRRSYTAEILNSSVGGSWPVSKAAHEAAAQWCAHLHRKHGIKLDRTHVFGHRELYTRYHAGYATACPGGLDVDWIVNRARQIVAGVAPKPATDTAEAEKEDEEMAIKQIHYKDGSTYHSAITDTSSGYWLEITSGSNDTMNEIYEKWDTTLSAEVSKSVWEAAERAAAAVRQDK